MYVERGRLKNDIRVFIFAFGFSFVSSFHLLVVSRWFFNIFTLIYGSSRVFDHLARRLRNPGPIGKRVRDAKSGQDDWFVSAVSPPQKRVHESSQTEAFSSPDTCDEESMNPSEFPLDSTLQGDEL